MAIDKRAPPHRDLATSGLLSHEPPDFDEAMDDFGHIVRRRPQAVFKPVSIGDVADLLQWATSRKLKVATRGQGHSVYGRAMAKDGIVLDMRAVSAIRDIQPDHMVVDAGATWSAVLDAALMQGLTPPVLTNYLELSVGGTLAVGGIGGTTFRYGMQTDNVISLDVVTGDGRKLSCSENVNSDLFDAVRGGLGQCGVITRATLRLISAPERVRRYHLLYTDLRALTADMRSALADHRFDYLQGAILPDGSGAWRYQLEGVVFYNGVDAPDEKTVLADLKDQREAADISDLAYDKDIRVFARLEALLRSNGQWFNPHPWLLTFLPGSNAEEIANEVLRGLTNADVGPFGRITYYPVFTEEIRTPLLRLPDESVVFPFNLVRIPSSNDAKEAADMIAANRTLYEHIRNAGGLLYPVSAFPMSQADWRDHFGSVWSILADARRRYDPEGILTPGYEIF